MSGYAATMGLTPMSTHYIDVLNYDTNLIRRRMDEGNIDVTVYVSVPLTGPDAVMQVYMYTGMPFTVKPGFFVHIESEFFFLEAFCDISHRLGGITPFGVFSDAFPGLKMWVTFACATAKNINTFYNLNCSA
jgi:hypothetical protein